MRLILLFILILLWIGALPTWPCSSGWGCHPSSGPGLLFLMLIILAAVGVIGGVQHQNFGGLIL